MINHESSFKDPHGFIIEVNNEVFRVVRNGYKDEYNHLMTSGLFDELLREQLIIEHQEITNSEIESSYGSDLYRILKPTRVSISYPSEWSFSQLKDAAICTLRIQQIALKYNMVLKDSSAYNIQFYQGRPVLIDTLSFRLYKSGEPWLAYRQFCEHFYGPLLLIAHVDHKLASLYNTFIDGIPLELINKLIPFRKKFSLGVFLHIVMHSRSKIKHRNASIHTVQSRFTKEYVAQLTDSLLSNVNDLRWLGSKTSWSHYYIQDVSDDYFKAKADIVIELLTQNGIRKALDFGANDGSISRQISLAGIEVVSTDYDHASVDRNYNSIKAQRMTSVLPLIIDATNPTPSFGWANSERQSFTSRLEVNAVVALALIHHLVIFYNIPFEKAAAYFASIADHLVIEFVPRHDPMVKILLQGKEDFYGHYTPELFEAAFEKFFRLIKRIPISHSERILYHYQK